MNMKTSRISQTEVAFGDTKDAGGIAVSGFELSSDENGHVFGPASLEHALKPHGFFREGTPEYIAWQEKRKAKAAEPKQKKAA